MMEHLSTVNQFRLSQASKLGLEITAGAFESQIMVQQFHYILAQVAGIIADRDPECLHQMSVGFHHFQAAIAVLAPVLSAKQRFNQAKQSCNVWASEYIKTATINRSTAIH